MWFWGIIKGVLYNIFVRIWYVGLIIVALIAFYGIMVFEALKECGHKLIGFFVLLIFAGGGIYIIYWYFANRHYILGLVSMLICFAVLYMAYIEPRIRR